jgi:hypothetical protein
MVWRQYCWMNRPAARLRLQAQLTTLEFEGSNRITLPVGPRGLADAVLLMTLQRRPSWSARSR